MRDKIRKLLARGLPQKVVADAVGVTESYVSQLLAEEDFAKEVAEMKLALVEEGSNRDAALNRIEDKLVEKLEKALPMMLKPGEILGAFKVINGARRHGETSTGLNPGLAFANQQIVQVNLPAVTINNFVKNHQNEVIEVGGRSLATMPAASLRNLAAARKETRNAIPEAIKETERREADLPAALDALETAAA